MFAPRIVKAGSDLVVCVVNLLDCYSINGFVFVGKFEDLSPIAEKLGGELRPLEAIDFLTGNF